MIGLRVLYQCLINKVHTCTLGTSHVPWLHKVSPTYRRHVRTADRDDVEAKQSNATLTASLLRDCPKISLSVQCKSYISPRTYVGFQMFCLEPSNAHILYPDEAASYKLHDPYPSQLQQWVTLQHPINRPNL